MKEVKEFLKEIPGSTGWFLKEGGSYKCKVRALGLKYEWLIFDDDNEPAFDYLEQLLPLIHQYPSVACWGPGNITVEYTGKKVPGWMEYYKESFQQKSLHQVQISKQEWWQEFYPPGTGLAIKKEVALEYVKRVKVGHHT